jgi:F-box protein 21
MRLKKAKEVQKAVQTMSSVAYPFSPHCDQQVNCGVISHSLAYQSPLIVINKLIVGSYPIPEYVQNELEELISDKNM